MTQQGSMDVSPDIYLLPRARATAGGAVLNRGGACCFANRPPSGGDFFCRGQGVDAFRSNNAMAGAGCLDWRAVAAFNCIMPSIDATRHRQENQTFIPPCRHR